MSKNKKPDSLGFVFSTNPDFQFQPTEPEQVKDLLPAQLPLNIWSNARGGTGIRRWVANLLSK